MPFVTVLNNRKWHELEQKEMIDADWIAENGLLEKKSGGQMGVDLVEWGLAILREHRCWF
jgi:hypothetical protein